MEFADFTYANNHKKRFHPHLYVDEMRQRAEDRKKNGVKKVVYHTIPISLALDRTVFEIPKARPFEIVLNCISLPGFLCNDWISLPKSEKDYPWLLEEDVKKPESLPFEGASCDFTFNDNSDINTISDHDNVTKDIEPDFDWPILDIKSLRDSTSHAKRNYFIQPEEIPDVPKFLGAKFIYNVYNKRNSQKKQERKNMKNKEMGLVTPEKRSKREKHTYKQSVTVQCKICGEHRSNIRAHIVTHHYEENETVCRICGYTVTAPRIFRQHYKLKHDILFREYLMQLQKEKIDKGQNMDTGDYVTCNVCFTNMKHADDLKFHFEMLHDYDTQGGRKSTKNRVCHICGKKFERRQYLLIHLRRTHKQTKAAHVFCHYCGKGCENKSSLRIHFYAAHHFKDGQFLKADPKSYQWTKSRVKDRLVCELCGDVLKTRWSMLKHNYERHDIRDQEFDSVIE